MRSKQFNLQNLIIRLTIISTFLLSAINTIAQQHTAIDEVLLNKLFNKFNESQHGNIPKKQLEHEFDQMIKRSSSQLDIWLQEKLKIVAEQNKNYHPGYKHKGEDMNLFPLWDAIPIPVSSLPEAKQTNFEVKYQVYTDKISQLKKQLSDRLYQHIDASAADQQSMMSEAKGLADQNAFVQQMGGADAISKMSEQERKEAAKKTAEKFSGNPGMVTGMTNEGMNAMAQRMMSDPKYREAYNKMSDAQKTEELKKYMGNTTEKRNDAASQAHIRENAGTNNMANVEILLGKCLQQMQQAAIPFSEGTTLANAFFTTIYADIESWYKKTYDALPETITHEKIGHGNLIKCREALLYSVHKKEALIRTMLFSILKDNTKLAFGEFNDFIGSYPWGKNKIESLVNGKNTEPKVAQAVSSMYDEMIRMAGEAERATKLYKGWQEQYELIVK